MMQMDLKFKFKIMNPNPHFSQLNGRSITLFFLLSISYTAAQIQSQPPAHQPPPVPIDMSPKFKVSPSMAIILVCLFTAFFFMGCVSVTVRQCADRRIRRALIAAGGIGSGRHSRFTEGNGLDPAVVNTFPLFHYSDVKRHRIGSGTLECAVCLNEFESDESLRLLPKCSHAFHPDCIDSWLVSHVTCPVCRADLVPQPGDTRPVPLLLHDSDNESLTSELDGSAYDVIISIESPQVINPTLTPNHPRSNSKKSSQSNYEKFTLRLPEEVKSQLMNPSLIRTRSCLTFSRVRSQRKGYRSRSVGGSSQPEWWSNVMKTPSIFSLLNSSRSPKPGVTVKSPLRIVDDIEPGERSFERLKPGL